MSFVRRARGIAVAVSSAIITAIVVVHAMGVGDFTMSPDRVVSTLFGYGNRQENLIILSVRFPRILTGVAAGAALGLAGAIMQTTARNALASPDLLGVTAGASAGAVAVITLGNNSDTARGLLRNVGVPGAAIIGAAVATAMVFTLVRKGGLSGLRPLLMGVGVSAFFGGIVSWLLIAAPIRDASRANVWLTGSLNLRSWPEFWPIAVAVALAAIALIPLGHRLDSLALGTDVARGLGLRVGAVALVFICVAVVLTAVSAAAVGPLGFVALVGPHVARLASNATRAPLFASALFGSLLVVSSDLLARTLFAPIQLPAGAVIAIVGAPFLLWLLISERRKTEL